MILKKRIAAVCLMLVLLLGAGLLAGTPAAASDPFVAQVKAFGFNFAPRGWAACNGQLLPIASNTALFSLIGTTYGGDGRTTTGLPDLQGRAVMHAGRGPGLTDRRLGQRGGVEAVTLSEAQIPSHTHTLRAYTGRGNRDTPERNVLAYHPRNKQYSSAAPDVSMNTGSISRTGGSQSHENMSPYLTVNYCIALVGIYPSRN
ncbi:MAG: tail fiber protein [Desulfobacula sp.]|uniref:phage tail protein n=1 Tax=Desulfobacula sp. TaxID=2593537 RepID=UPI0025BC451C|nr:tail fiber protein [Desulfobacula sp.]MCD4718404.1 tail fiber protein [Desulfobacula sp.]